MHKVMVSLDGIASHERSMFKFSFLNIIIIDSSIGP